DASRSRPRTVGWPEHGSAQGPRASAERDDRNRSIREAPGPVALIASWLRAGIGSAAAAIGLDALLGNPHAVGWRAVLPEHVDGNAAARIPIAADPEPGGIDKLDDALADGDGRVFMEGAHIAVAREIELERLRLHQPFAGRIVDNEMREIRLAGHRAETGEFRAGEARDISRVAMRVRHALEHGLRR